MKSFKQFIKEDWGQTQAPQDYNGSNGLPYTPATYDGTVPVAHPAVPSQLDHQGRKWNHTGRTSVDPNSTMRLYQYVAEHDLGNPNVDTVDTVWADTNGQVVGSQYPASANTPTKDSVKAKPVYQEDGLASSTSLPSGSL